MSDSERYSEVFGQFDDIDETHRGEDFDLFEQYLAEEDDMSMPERGDLREGIIVEKRANELLINVGGKRDGVVSASDLDRLEDDYLASLKEGDTVPVVVSKLTTDEGMLILSIADALQKRDWLTAEKMLESGEIGMYTVASFNKGGLLVNFGHLRGFIPASHVVGLARNLSEDERNHSLQEMIGQELPVKVIEVERRRRRLVLSHRYAERAYRTQRKEELFREMKVGDVVMGEVRSLRPFGAFVDIGGADGLLHVSEIGWTPVSHPRDVLQIGDKIQVEILRLDADRSRIALSRKQLLPNPWEHIEERYKSGDTIVVTVTRVVDFGAFAQLEPGVEGLIHISELADIAIADPLRTVQPGDRLPVKILRVDPDRQRIGLSHRQADSAIGQALLEDELDELQASRVPEAKEAPQVDWAIKPEEDGESAQDADPATTPDTASDAALDPDPENEPENEEESQA